MNISWQQQLLLSFAVGQLCSALGGKRIVYFVSLDYAISLARFSGLGATLHSSTQRCLSLTPPHSSTWR